jgi:hypothetical protein
VVRRAKSDLIVLAGYAVISFGYFGWRLFPHPGRVMVGFGHDPEIYIWSFAWWPHAIGSWTNPFVSHALYAPSGVNIAWTPSASGLALLFSPLTVLFGPVASYNVANVLMPSLSAFTAYLLCRYLTRSVWASVVGGYLYGFSTAMLRHQHSGHLNLTGRFLIPLIPLVLLRYFRAELTARGVAWRLGALVALQLWISTELTATSTFMLVIALTLGFLLVRNARQRLRASVVPIMAGYALGVIFAAPFVVYALLGFVPYKFIGSGVGSDVLDFILPNGVIGIGGSYFDSSIWSHVHTGHSAYLGIPTLLIVTVFGIRFWRAAWARALLAVLGVAAVISLGSPLQVDGHHLFALPWWNVIAHVPGLSNAISFRFALFTSLAAAVIVAIWTATANGRIYSRPYVLPALAVAALVPAFWQASYPSFFPTHPRRLAFFTQDLYKSCIPKNEIVALFAEHTLLWQAESGFWFGMATNGLQPFPKYGKPLNSFDADKLMWELDYVDTARPTMDSLLAFAARHHVGRFLADPENGYPSATQMRRFGRTQLVGGVLVAPACGQAPLTHRDLTTYVRAYQEQLLHPRDIGYCVGSNFYLVPVGLYPAGPLNGARRAIFISGRGLSCPPVPTGYKRHGFATTDLNVPAHTYPLYVPRDGYR